MTATDTIDGPGTARAKSQGAAKTASLYRMAMPGHLCPFGLKSKSLLERKGFTVDDNLLTTGDEVDAFKKAHDVQTTPIAFIGGERVGGYTDLKSISATAFSARTTRPTRRSSRSSGRPR